jgi:putative transposase
MNQDFERASEPTYTYDKLRQQKRLEQTKRRGRRLSIVGLFQHESSFVYGLVIRGVKRKAYIKMMELEAQSAAHIAIANGL